MANFNNLSLTAKGLRALIAAQAGTELTLSKIGMGSGFTNNIASLTALVSPELMLPISDMKSDAGYLSIAAKMTNQELTKGFYWRETGLFFEDLDGNDVLFAYASTTDQYDYVPPYSDNRYVKHIRIANITTDSADIKVKEAAGLLYVDNLTFDEFRESLFSYDSTTKTLKIKTTSM